MVCLNIVSAANYLHKDQTAKTWLSPKHWLSQYIISILSFFLHCYCTSFRYITWCTNEKYQHSISARFSLHSLNISYVIYQNSNICISFQDSSALLRFCRLISNHSNVNCLTMSRIFQLPNTETAAKTDVTLPGFQSDIIG